MKTIAAAAAGLAVMLAAPGARARPHEPTSQQKEAFKNATALSQRENQNHKASDEPKFPVPPAASQGDGK